MRKTSVYLDEDQAQRLARLAREEGRSQAGEGRRSNPNIVWKRIRELHARRYG
jgi:hypothetical protein